MEFKTVSLLGALVGATAGGASAQAASNDSILRPATLAVTSYADLLQPIPNAVEILRAHNAELTRRANSEPGGVERVQWSEGEGEYDHHHHHHHHHHHEYYSPPEYYAPPPPVWHHHHHHHHHSGGVILLPGIGVQIN